RDRLADTMQRFYGLPYESFERYCPAGRPEHVSEHLAPFLEAGGQNFNLIPIAASVDDAIDGAGQVQRSLVGSRPRTPTSPRPPWQRSCHPSVSPGGDPTSLSLSWTTQR